MNEIEAIDDPRAAEASLHPVRSRLLAELIDGATATTVAAKLGLTRQKANYHLRILEANGLVELVEERRKRNTTERVMRATAESYVISPAALATVAPDPDRAPDQLSARWLLALAGRMVQELGTLIGRSREAEQPLASFAIDAEITFASARDRATFVAELSDNVERLLGTYHSPQATGSRRHRLLLALHPSITDDSGGPEGSPSPADIETKED